MTLFLFLQSLFIHILVSLGYLRHLAIAFFCSIWFYVRCSHKYKNKKKCFKKLLDKELKDTEDRRHDFQINYCVYR